MLRTRMQSDAPIGQDREQQYTDEEVGSRTYRVRKDVRARAVQSIHAFAHEDLALFEERRDAGDGHEPEERYGEEVHGKSVVLQGWEKVFSLVFVIYRQG